MKYISLLNPITIKYLIDNPNTKYFITNIKWWRLWTIKLFHSWRRKRKKLHNL